MQLNIFRPAFGYSNFPYHPFFKNIYSNPPKNISFVEIYNDEYSKEDHEKYINLIKNKCKEEKIEDNFIDLYFSYLNYSGAMENSRLMKKGIPVWVAVLPQYVGPNDWILEVEDFWLAFLPWIGNGDNYNIDLKKHWLVKILKIILEMDNCKQIITHTKNTLHFIKTVLGEKVFSKSNFCQQSVVVKNIKDYPKEKDFTTFLFHGSWNHTSYHFFFRGGLETIYAFQSAYEVNPNMKLIVNYKSEMLTPEVVNFLFSNPGIEYIPHYLSDEEMNDLRFKSDVLVIPAYRLHSMSTLTSLCIGNPVICSDGWGFDEYVMDNYNGIICKGQICSYYDDEGIMRENYHIGSKESVNIKLKNNVEKAMLLLSENLTVYNNMRRNCIREYYKNYRNEVRNSVLSEIIS